MDRGLKYSLVLHCALIFMIVIGLPSMFQREPDLLTPIPIELMSAAEMAEQSSAPLKKVPKDKPEEPKDQPKPKPKPKPTEETPEPPKEEVKPEPVKEEPKPEPKVEPKPEPKPEPLKEQPKPEAKPEPKPEGIKPPEKKPEPPKEKDPPKPVPKPKPKDTPKPKPEPKKKDEKPQPKNKLSSVLKNLKKEIEDNTPTKDLDVNDFKETDSSPVSATNVSDMLTQDELSALRRQIKACWNMPAGALGASDLVVEIRVQTNPDRTVRHAEIVDTGRMSRDPYFRTAAESALRAVHHPMCNPLMLPPNKYDQWKSFVFLFNPQDML
jgi:hypothetical protein